MSSTLVLVFLAAILPSETTEIVTSCSAEPNVPDPVVLFEPKSHELDRLAKDTLECWATALRNSDSMICFWLVGECDPATDGASCGNFAASRVREVRSYLVEFGVDGNLLASLPSGRAQPPCTYTACQVSNRRVFLMSPGQGDCRSIPH